MFFLLNVRKFHTDLLLEIKLVLNFFISNTEVNSSKLIFSDLSWQITGYCTIPIKVDINKVDHVSWLLKN
jgi:hypothetical protein